MDTKKNNSKKSADLKSHKDVVFLCGAFLLSAAFLMTVVSPLYQKKLAMDTAYAAKENDLKNKEELLKNIEVFNEENKDLTVNSEKLALLIPNRNNYEDFLIHIQNLSRSSNLDLLNFTLREIKPATTVTAATTTSTGAIITPEKTITQETDSRLEQQGIDLTLRGAYSDFVKFAKDLENGIPFLQEDKIVIGSEKISGPQNAEEGQAANSNPMLSFGLSLRFIHY
jgi:hypothetical protein